MTVRVLITIGLLLIGFDCADFTVQGVTFLGIGFLLAAAYLAGVFTREFWIEDDPRLDAIDIEISARERQLRASLTPAGGNPPAATPPQVAAPPAGSHD